MSAKENFNRAMFDMFGIGKDPNEKKPEETKAEVKKKKNSRKSRPLYIGEQFLRKALYLKATLLLKEMLKSAGSLKVILLPTAVLYFIQMYPET